MNVAIVTTIWRPDSHADVIGTRLVRGYDWHGQHIPPRVTVVAAYVEQIENDDMSTGLLAEHGIPTYPTVGEALMNGGRELAVDGVVIIGEHGAYERNEFEQTLYPRRRLFDAAVATMIGAGRTVPIFNDKHLAWSFTDARAMVDTAKRLGIPMLAGSTIPLGWRQPIGTDWPFGARMDGAVLVGHGPTEIYGFHALEGLQVIAERRAGGESGVAAVTGLSGPEARAACTDERVDPGLLREAFATFALEPDALQQAIATIRDVFIVEYIDGLRGVVVMCDEVITDFGVAAQGPDDSLACRIRLQGYPYGHFIFLVRHIETLVTSGQSPYPVERTLLTTGILDAAMHSRKLDGARQETPELAIAYEAVEHLENTGHHEPLRPARPNPRKQEA